MADWEHFMNRATMLSRDYYALSHAEKIRAFSYTGAASIEQVKHVRDQLANTLRDGGTYGDFKKGVLSGDIDIDLPDARLRNIFRTNVMSAHGRGRYKEQMDTANVWPYLKYQTARDDRVRPNHAGLDGVIVEFGSAEANQIYPPNGYQCRCNMRALSASEASTQRKYSESETKAVIAANQPDSGFEGPPFAGSSMEELNVDQGFAHYQGKTMPDAQYKRIVEEAEAYPERSDVIRQMKSAIPESWLDNTVQFSRKVLYETEMAWAAEERASEALGIEKLREAKYLRKEAEDAAKAKEAGEGVTVEKRIVERVAEDGRVVPEEISVTVPLDAPDLDNLPWRAADDGGTGGGSGNGSGGGNGNGSDSGGGGNGKKKSNTYTPDPDVLKREVARREFALKDNGVIPKNSNLEDQIRELSDMLLEISKLKYTHDEILQLGLDKVDEILQDIIVHSKSLVESAKNMSYFLRNERALVSLYTEKPFAAFINNNLRDFKGNEYIKKYRTHIRAIYDEISGLEMLENKYLFRGMKNISMITDTNGSGVKFLDLLKDFADGKISNPVVFECKGMMSFAEKYDVAKKFATSKGTDPLILRIRTNKGIPVQSVSVHPNEMERLFPGNIPLRLKKVTRIKGILYADIEIAEEGIEALYSFMVQ